MVRNDVGVFLGPVVKHVDAVAVIHIVHTSTVAVVVAVAVVVVKEAGGVACCHNV